MDRPLIASLVPTATHSGASLDVDGGLADRATARRVIWLASTIFQASQSLSAEGRKRLVSGLRALPNILEHWELRGIKGLHIGRLVSCEHFQFRARLLIHAVRVDSLFDQFHYIDGPDNDPDPPTKRYVAPRMLTLLDATPLAVASGRTLSAGAQGSRMHFMDRVVLSGLWAALILVLVASMIVLGAIKIDSSVTSTTQRGAVATTQVNALAGHLMSYAPNTGERRLYLGDKLDGLKSTDGGTLSDVHASGRPGAEAGTVAWVAGAGIAADVVAIGVALCNLIAAVNSLCTYKRTGRVIYVDATAVGAWMYPSVIRQAKKATWMHVDKLTRAIVMAWPIKATAATAGAAWFGARSRDRQKAGSTILRCLITLVEPGTLLRARLA